MTRDPHAAAGGARRRTLRRAALLIAAAAFVWLAAGLHRVPPASDGIRIRLWAFSQEAAVLAPGWALSPPLVARVLHFPAGPRQVSARWGGARPWLDAQRGGGGLASREGVRLLAAGTLTLKADPSRPAALARAFPKGWPDGRGDVLALALEPAVAGSAAETPFSASVQPGRGLPDGFAARLADLGLVPEGAGTLRFYPAPAAAPRAEPGSHPLRSGQARRVLLVGLDGADWDIIDPLMERGRMPYMKRLVASGARARLKTISPALSPIIWTSIATGVGPEKHGILDFMATSTATGKQIPVTSNMRQVKALWNILTDQGLSSGVIAWWATWPAEAVNGFIVSDRVAYQLFGYSESGESLRRRTFPEALGLVIQPLVVVPSEVADADLARFLPRGAAGDADGEDLTRRLKTILASTRTYLGIGLDLLAAYDPDFKAIYFEGTDTIAHNFMRYRPPAMLGVTAADLAAYGQVVDRYYEYQDEILGQVLELADEGTLVAVCSDHGFRTGSNRPPTDPRIDKGGAADWHRKFGILVLSGPGVRKGSRLEDVSVMDVAPTVLAAMGLPVAQDMSGRPLGEAFDPPLEPRLIATYEAGGVGAPRPEDPVGSAVDDEIIAKLTALGYVSQEGSNALNNTGITLLDRGRFGEAAEAFRRAVRQEPRFVPARINLGRAQMLMKDHDAAIATLQAVLRLDPGQAEVHNLLGNIYMERGDTRNAEASFRKSLALQPDDTNAHNSLGLLYDRLGKDELAIQEYRKVVAVDPDYAEGYNNIGLIHRRRGEPRRAIELFEQAIGADPDFAGSHNNMGLAYQDLGMLAEARRAFERGLQVDPDNAVILNNLGTVDLAEQDLAAARGRFEQAVRADPEYPSAYNNLGAVLGMLGKVDEAFEQYLKALDLDPAYTDARFNLARHFLSQRRTREAVEMLTKVLEIDPRYGKALLQLGIILAQQGDAEAALERVRQAAREMPGSPDPHNLMADIYLSLGRREEARRELKDSLRINAAQPKVSEMLQKLESGGL